MEAIERYFCATCKRKLIELVIWMVPPQTVAGFHDFLEREGLHASLNEGWYKCLKCDKCIHMPTVDAFEHKRFS
jgi:hypothetical protein